VCPINGAVRGKPTAVPPTSRGDEATPFGLALSTLSATGVLAEEYMRGMSVLAQGQDGVATIDLEEPYSLEAQRDTFVTLHKLLQQVRAPVDVCSLC